MNLFDRARKALRGLAPAASAGPQYYNVACPRGHRLQGERTEGYQALRCPSCGEGIFVLPRSPLPDPPAPARREPAPDAEPQALWDRDFDAVPVATAAPPAPGPAVAFDPSIAVEPDPDSVELELTDPPTTSPTPARAAPTPGPEAPEPPTRRGRRQRDEAAPDPAPAAVPTSTRPRLTWSEWAAKHRNPLIFCGVAAIVVLTVAFRARQEMLRDLPRVVQLGREEGIPALDAGEFDRAKALLLPAARAVERLGGQVEGAEEVRQAAIEVRLFTDLVPDTLERIVDEARSFDPERWPSHFDSFYKGRSILVDAPIAAAPASEGAGYDLDYRIYLGPGPEPAVRGRLDLAGFRGLEGVEYQPGDVVRFGARLASVRLDPGSGEWLIGLEPDSGVFITHNEALARLGIGPTGMDDAPGEVRP